MLTEKLQKFWGVMRELSGDDAYERYLLHHAQTHPEEIPLNRKEFFQSEQDRQWNSIKRCC